MINFQNAKKVMNLLNFFKKMFYIKNELFLFPKNNNVNITMGSINAYEIENIVGQGQFEFLHNRKLFP